MEKNLPANAGDARDTGSIPELRRSPAGGNPLQYSCLGNSMDRGAWWAIVQGVAKSQTGLTEHAGTRLYRMGSPEQFSVEKEELCSCLDGQSKIKIKCHLPEWDLSYKTIECEAIECLCRKAC